MISKSCIADAALNTPPPQQECVPDLGPAMEAGVEPYPERTPLRDKLAWALGSLGDNYAAQMLTQLAFPVYNITLGLPAEQLTRALSIPRWIDSFADPTVGYLSDNCRSRFGRRRPFILAGALPLAILAYCLWLPGVGWSRQALAWFVACGSLLYYLAYAVFIVPYRGLGFELTRDYNERTRVQGWGMAFGLIGGLGIPWLYKLALVFGRANPEATVYPPEVMLHGVRWVGLGVALIILTTCVAPAFFCREKAPGPGQKRLSMGEAVRETLESGPFLVMLFSRLLAIVATFSVSSISTPLMIYYLFGGNQSKAAFLQGAAGNVLFAGAAAGIPCNAWLSARFGKRHAYFGCLALAGVGCLSQALTYRPEHPSWILASNFIFGFGIQGVWLMCQSMVADVCDEDELRTGQRREGLYGAAYALLEKLGIPAGIYLAGLVATLCGYSVAAPGAEVLERMWATIVALPVAGFMMAGAVIYFYPLTHARMDRIRDELELRRQAEATGNANGARGASLLN